jgi:hypothetical protein
MTPLLLGAAWLLFVISCFASMTPAATKAPRKARGKDNEAA